MFKFKKMTNILTEKEAKKIANDFYSRNNSSMFKKHDIFLECWIEETMDNQKFKIELHTIVSPNYDEYGECEFTSYYDSYKELLEKNIYCHIYRALTDGATTVTPAIENPNNLLMSRIFSPIKIYINSQIVLPVKIMEQLGCHDWINDYYRNKANIEFINVKLGKDKYTKLASQEDFDSAINNYFKEYLKKNNIKLSLKQEKNIGTEFKKLLNDDNFKCLLGLFVTLDEQYCFESFFEKNNKTGIERIIIEHPEESEKFHHGYRWSALYDFIDNLRINSDEKALIIENREMLLDIYEHYPNHLQTLNHEIRKSYLSDEFETHFRYTEDEFVDEREL